MKESDAGASGPTTARPAWSEEDLMANLRVNAEACLRLMAARLRAWPANIGKRTREESAAKGGKP
jgi:hypothetical protein